MGETVRRGYDVGQAALRRLRHIAMWTGLYLFGFILLGGWID